MASEKLNLQRHFDYLQARRSGAEYCLDLVTEETARQKIKSFIHNLSTSIQESSVKLATIEKAELEKKARRKAEKEEAMKRLRSRS